MKKTLRQLLIEIPNIWTVNVTLDFDMQYGCHHEGVGKYDLTDDFDSRCLEMYYYRLPVNKWKRKGTELAVSLRA